MSVMAEYEPDFKKIGSLHFQIDEVLSELSGGGDDEEKRNESKHEHAEDSKKGSDLKDLKDLVRLASKLRYKWLQ